MVKKLLIDKSWYVKTKGILEHTSAGGVIVRLEDKKINIAFVKEKGLSNYVLPKGRVEKGETLEEAALREIKEEAGLTDLKLIGKLGARERLDFEKDFWKITHYFLFITEQKDGIPTDPNHKYGVFWFPLDKLPPIFWPEQKELIVENRSKIKRLVSTATR